jgi:hypothetical protein
MEVTTSVNIKEQLEAFKKQWLTPITCVVTDNAANFKAAILDSDLLRVPCAAHTLQLSVQKGLVHLKDLLKNVKKTVTYFAHSPKATNKLLGCQELFLPSSKPVKLVQAVKTRWNSVYLMLDRFHRVKNFLGLLWNTENLNECKLQEHEWITIEDSLSLLQPFYKATKVLSTARFPTISIIYPMLLGLMKHLENFQAKSDSIVNVKNDIYEDIQKRWNNIPSSVSNTLLCCTLLDPRSKSLLFFSKQQIQTAWNYLTELYYDHCSKNVAEEPVETPTKKQKTASFLQELLLTPEIFHSNEELCEYSLELQIKCTEDPLQWWAIRKQKYKVLYNLARVYLSIPASSVPCERLFSDAGNIIVEKRASLEPDFAAKLIMLYENKNCT